MPEITKELPPFYRQKGTGKVLSATKFLAERGDMEPYYPDKTKGNTTHTVVDSTHGVVMPDSVVDSTHRVDITPTENEEATNSKGVEGLIEPDANRINLILEAMEQLDADKDFTAAGLPRLDALEKVLGIAVTKDERLEALEIRGSK